MKENPREREQRTKKDKRRHEVLAIVSGPHDAETPSKDANLQEKHGKER